MEEPHTAERDLTRRGLLGVAAAAGAALAAGRRPELAEARKRKARRRRRAKHVDVVVVGAGLAGLTAARELRKKGRKVIVVEARGRVGGRTYTKHVHGVAVDVGGQWLKTKPSVYGPIQADTAQALLQERARVDELLTSVREVRTWLDERQTASSVAGLYGI